MEEVELQHPKVGGMSFDRPYKSGILGVRIPGNLFLPKEKRTVAYDENAAELFSVSGLMLDDQIALK